MLVMKLQRAVKTSITLHFCTAKMYGEMSGSRFGKYEDGCLVLLRRTVW
jgi:hypothetical protein